ncbi:hypothetical protein SAMN05216330_12441 [Bradyrhizobium sp. Ghvi]|nr:hypothetical protein SAMN05216330_12441 [Bradyrhizobium sp. Ghvi]
MPARHKLRLELIPGPLWGQNLRSNVLGLGPGRWLKLSRTTRSALGRCVICGGTDRLQGHESWKYVEKPRSGVAILVGVDAICTVCHSVQHWGRIQQLLAIGVMTPADERRLIRHFMKINKCNRAAFERHVVRSFGIWRSRSKKKWKIDWGAFEPMIIEAKAARDLYRRRREAAAGRRMSEWPVRKERDLVGLRLNGNSNRESKSERRV